jgi:glycosyltransferase involved in cell wall biosynthesis
MNPETQKPVVTVCILLYNKVKYLRDALDSVLEQEADFPWNIMISDDCSTDGSREIAQEYAAKYPDKIELVIQEKNKGVGGNSLDLFKRPISKYVAYLDPDDIFTDKKKLQKQVDFLEKHPQYAMVYGKSTLMDEEGKPLPLRKWPKYRSGKIFKEVILFKYLPQFSSALVRTVALQDTLRFPDNPGTDFFFMARITHDNLVYFMDEFFFCYRKNQHSITVTSFDHMFHTQTPPALRHFQELYPRLMKKANRRAHTYRASVMAERNPGIPTFFRLIKHMELSSWYFRQLAKCGIRMFMKPFKRNRLPVANAGG